MRARRDEPTAVARFAARAPEDDPERVSVSVCDVACLSNQSGDSSETTVVTCANDGTVAMWRSQNVNNDAASATKEGRSMRGDLTVLGCHDGAVAVACSASRGVVSSGGLDGRVRFWKMDTRRSFARSRNCIGALRQCAAVRSVAFTSDGDSIVTACDDKTVKIHNLVQTESREKHGAPPDFSSVISVRATHQATLVGHTNWVREVSASRDDALACSASDDRTVKLWDLAVGSCVNTYEDVRGLPMYATCFHPDGYLVAGAGASKSVQIWDVRCGRLALAFARAHEQTIRSVSFHPGGHHAATTSDDGTVKIWELRAGRLAYTLRAHGDKAVSRCAFSSGESDVFVSGGSDGKCVVWRGDFPTSTALKTTGRIESLGYEIPKSRENSGKEDDVIDVPASTDGVSRHWPTSTKSTRANRHVDQPSSFRARARALTVVFKALHHRLFDIESALDARRHRPSTFEFCPRGARADLSA